MIEFLSAFVAEDVVLVNHTTAVVAMVNLFFLLFCFHEISYLGLMCKYRYFSRIHQSISEKDFQNQQHPRLTSYFCTPICMYSEKK